MRPNVYNNIIVNNVSTHEGGGIAIDDAPNVRIYNNTIMKNVTTATAVTSNGQPAPAGLSTGRQQRAAAGDALPRQRARFSNPLLFNNILWDNRAGTRRPGTVTGIGAAGRRNRRSTDGTSALPTAPACSRPTNSIVQQEPRPIRTRRARPTSATDPAVVDAYERSLVFAPWRTNPNFIGAILVGQTCRRSSSATTTSPTPDASLRAYNTGAANKARARATSSRRRPLRAPPTDIDEPAAARPAVDSTSARTRSRRPSPTCPSPRPTASRPSSPGGPLTYTIVVAQRRPEHRHRGARSRTRSRPRSPSVAGRARRVAGSSCTAGGSGNARTGTVTLAQRRQRDLHGRP